MSYIEMFLFTFLPPMPQDKSNRIAHQSSSVIACMVRNFLSEDAYDLSFTLLTRHHRFITGVLPLPKRRIAGVFGQNYLYLMYLMIVNQFNY